MSGTAMDTKEKLHAKLAELESELAEIERIEADAQRRAERRRELCGGFRSHGKIGNLRAKIRDFGLPIAPEGSGWCTQVIHDVNGQWIVLRELHGSIQPDDMKYFRRSDGRLKGTRSECRGRVDVEKIVAIWDEYQSGLKAHGEQLETNA